MLLVRGSVWHLISGVLQVLTVREQWLKPFAALSQRDIKSIVYVFLPTRAAWYLKSQRSLAGINTSV